MSPQYIALHFGIGLIYLQLLFTSLTLSVIISSEMESVVLFTLSRGLSWGMEMIYINLVCFFFLSAKTVLRRQVMESGQAVRKHCMEQSRQSSGSGNRQFPQPSQVRACKHPAGEKIVNNC